MKNTNIRRTAKIKFHAVLLILLALSPKIIFAQEISSTTEISWEKGEILITAKTAIPNTDTNLTAVRLELTEYIDRQLTNIVLSSFSKINMDSLNNLNDAFTKDINRLSVFDSMNMKKKRTSSSMSIELDYVINNYRYDINKEIIPLLTSQDKGKPVPIELNYTSNSKFSGIVIYAGDELPLYGENTQGKLQPAIFPKIFSHDMIPIVSVSMMDSDFLYKWGMVQYSEDFDERKYEHRIGVYPFRTIAEAVFGNNRTDIIISKEAAAKILYLKENRELIKEGRILIILPH